jgi:hypothetical protein
MLIPSFKAKMRAEHRIKESVRRGMPSKREKWGREFHCDRKTNAPKKDEFLKSLHSCAVFS